MQVVSATARSPGEIAPLLYMSGVVAYDGYVGSKVRALGAIEDALDRPSTSASRDVIWLALADGMAAGLLGAFPSNETATRSRGFLKVAARHAPPRLWPRLARLYLAGRRGSPAAAADTYYVDALAADPTFRRRGVGRRLLEQAEANATQLGLPTLTLDTTADNSSAQRLYESFGFERVGIDGSAILYRKPL